MTNLQMLVDTAAMKKETDLHSQRKREVDVLARTIYGEARGETVRGKEAVACVIMNRVRRAQERGGYWWGASVEKVCLKPWQFSCWNEHDPNREKIQQVERGGGVFDSLFAHRAPGGVGMFGRSDPRRDPLPHLARQPTVVAWSSRMCGDRSAPVLQRHRIKENAMFPAIIGPLHRSVADGPARRRR